MKPPSEPKINRTDPKKYFIEWNHDVPEPLWPYYPRRRVRIKTYAGDINRFKGDEREAEADKWCKVWKYQLEVLKFDPFQYQLDELRKINERRNVIHTVIDDNKKVAAAVAELTPAEKRKLTPARKALTLWVESRMIRTTNVNTISTYRVTATWLTAYLETIGRAGDPINSITRMEIADGLNLRKAERKWEATTYNNEYDTLVNVFNWLESEEYITANPIVGKIVKIKANKHKNKWYDKDLMITVVDALIASEEWVVLRAMLFTYYIMIRSKTEIMKLKAGDIDRTLKRIHFSADLSKNGIESYRDYQPEFDQILDWMDFDGIPKNFYIFGRSGEPSEFKCHKDLLADKWRPVRDLLELSADYTIYGAKHTRIVHELMKGTEGVLISYMARHEDPKSKSEYQRDYDISLVNVYKPEDLTFYFPINKLCKDSSTVTDQTN